MVVNNLHYNFQEKGNNWILFVFSLCGMLSKLLMYVQYITVTG